PLSGLLDHKLAAGAIMLAMVSILYWFQVSSTQSTFSADCQVLDQAASAHVAQLIGDTSASAEVRLADALFRLKRARNHCRNGWFGLARQDYEALIVGLDNEQR